MHLKLFYFTELYSNDYIIYYNKYYLIIIVMIIKIIIILSKIRTRHNNFLINNLKELTVHNTGMTNSIAYKQLLLFFKTMRSLFLSSADMKTTLVCLLALCAVSMVFANSCSDMCLASYTTCEQKCRDAFSHSHQYDQCAATCTTQRAECDAKCHGGSGK